MFFLLTGQFILISTDTALSYDQGAIHAEKGRVEMCDFCIAAIMSWDKSTIKAWDKSKNPCPHGNCTFPNLVHHQGLESTWPVASHLPDPDDAPCWKMCDFGMDMGSCYMS